MTFWQFLVFLVGVFGVAFALLGAVILWSLRGYKIYAPNPVLERMTTKEYFDRTMSKGQDLHGS